MVYASLSLLYRSLFVRTIKKRGVNEKPIKGLQQGPHAGARLSDCHRTQQNLINSSGAEVTASAGLIAETPTAHRTKFLVCSGEAIYLSVGTLGLAGARLLPTDTQRTPRVSG